MVGNATVSSSDEIVTVACFDTDISEFAFSKRSAPFRRAGHSTHIQHIATDGSGAASEKKKELDENEFNARSAFEKEKLNMVMTLP